MAQLLKERMPINVSEHLAETLHLNCGEHGSYLLLLMAYWSRRGPLLDDDEMLARIVKATPREWQRYRPTLELLFRIDGGLWHHARLDGQIDKMLGIVEHRAAAGHKGGNARAARLAAEAA